MVPRVNKNNAYVKFLENDERLLFHFPKWPIENRSIRIRVHRITFRVSALELRREEKGQR